MPPVIAAAVLAAVILCITYMWQAVRAGPTSSGFSEYFFGNWSLRSHQVAATLFSSAMSLATVVIALLQLTPLLGIGLCFATLSFCTGWLLLQRTAPRILQRVGRTDTLHSFLGRFYVSDIVRRAAALVTIIGLLGLFATELFAVDVLVSALGVSSTVSPYLIVLFGVFAIVHASLGGFRAVVKSDPYQSILLLISFGVLLFIAIMSWSSIGRPQLKFAGQIGSAFLPWPILMGLFMINVPFPFVDTLTWQRLIASSSSSAYARGSFRAVLGFSLTWTILIAAGILLAAHGTGGFLALIAYCASLSPVLAFVLAALLFPGLIAAMLSSSDAFLNSAAHGWCLDVLDY